MIEPTTEMRTAFLAAAEGICICPICLNHRLAAVLAIADRDRPATQQRCADCGRAARELVAVPDGDSTVLLGPTCHRRRLEAGQVRQALPIGGAR